jgi:prepilin-type N-terminal cleavage/methylation domain-containing protein
MQRRVGWTLVESLVVLAILAVVFSLIIGGCNSTMTGYDQHFDAEVIRKYEVVKTTGDPPQSQTVYRLDVRRRNNKEIETVENFDNWWRGKRNSATVHANVAEGKWYKFHTAGQRSEWWSWFPNVLTAQEIQSPTEVKGEIDY